MNIFQILEQRDERGSFWTSNDIAPYLDYKPESLRRGPVKRAEAWMRAEGYEVVDHFTRLPGDVRLSRMAVNFVIISGSRGKVGVQRARGYMVQKTLEAEAMGHGHDHPFYKMMESIKRVDPR